jgi:hypothetical protein
MRQRKRKPGVQDFSEYENENCKVIEEIRPGKWKVQCKKCNKTHEINSKSIRENRNIRECEQYKPHNWSGLDRWDAIIRRQYGITLEEYYKLKEFQNGGCAICGRQEEPDGRKLSIDHDHTTGIVRGILCYSCNRALGLFYDIPERLEKAAKYLRDNPYQIFKNRQKNTVK